MPISIVENIDCIEGMKQFPDNYFELAICDPPYGIGHSNSPMNSILRGTGHISRIKKDWDKEIPSLEYFLELFRVSKNQIIWGGNYFTDHLPASRGWIFWDKLFEPHVQFSSGELAWTSFDKVLKKAEIGYKTYKNNVSSSKAATIANSNIHPTQKPISLYTWILEHYAKQGDKILDTHLGSQSSRIAAYKKGFDFWGFELDETYFKQGNERFQTAIAMPLFDAPKEVYNQLSLV